MANGYLHISRDDLVAGDGGVVYWKNGGRILGEVVSCVDSDENVHYYLKTTNIKKAILIDAFVPVGVTDYMLYSDSANFINVQINTEDFTDIGGGAGISITFLLPEGKYYTVKNVEANGDIKIFDPAGDGGEIGGGGGSKYQHNITISLTTTYGPGDLSLTVINDDETPFTIETFRAFVLSLGVDAELAINGVVYTIVSKILSLYTKLKVINDTVIKALGTYVNVGSASSGNAEMILDNTYTAVDTVLSI